MSNDTVRTHGPFTWRKRDNCKDEIWDLDLPSIAGLTSFSLKNYGGTPGPGFSGWKLVSGGPFDDAGAFDTFEHAVIDVTDYLIDYYQDQSERMAEQAEKLRAAVTGFNAHVSSHREA